MKKISDYTHEELLNMAPEELSALFDNEREVQSEKIKNFETEEYPNYSFDEKAKFWSSSLHRQMRWQVESSLDPYAIYDLEWYLSVKKQEPNIDAIMNEVFEKYWSSTGGVWNKQEYLKRITESSN